MDGILNKQYIKIKTKMKRFKISQRMPEGEDDDDNDAPQPDHPLGDND